MAIVSGHRLPLVWKNCKDIIIIKKEEFAKTWKIYTKDKNIEPRI